MRLGTRGHETGDRRQGTWGHETWGHETGDRRQETGDMRLGKYDIEEHGMGVIFRLELRDRDIRVTDVTGYQGRGLG